MIRLEKSETFQRKIRQEDIAELSIPTWTIVRNAVREGRIEDALEYIDYGLDELQRMHNSMNSHIDDAATYLAHNFGEEELLKFYRERFTSIVKDKWLSKNLSVEEALQLDAEGSRGHFDEYAIREDQDKYVLSGMCGGGGRLATVKNVARSKKASPWSWNQKDVPYICFHCCIAWEIIPTELRGYPVRIHLRPEKPGDPCHHLFYKKPELIPEEYFTRIGMTKTIK